MALNSVLVVMLAILFDNSVLDLLIYLLMDCLPIQFPSIKHMKYALWESPDQIVYQCVTPLRYSSMWYPDCLFTKRLLQMPKMFCPFFYQQVHED